MARANRWLSAVSAMLEPATLAEIEAARVRIADAAIRTPLVRLNVDDAPADIYLKLENLNPLDPSRFAEP